MNKTFLQWIIVCAMILLISFCMAESTDAALSDLNTDDIIQTEEDALHELEPLLKDSDLEKTNGMDLEAFSAEYLNQYLMEYYDSETGFSFLYPAWFVMDEQNGTQAQSQDGLSTMTINVTELSAPMTEEELNMSVRNSGYSDVTSFGEGRFLAKENGEDGTLMIKVCQLTEGCIYSVEMSYPREQQDQYTVYIEYLINSMTADDTDLG